MKRIDLCQVGGDEWPIAHGLLALSHRWGGIYKSGAQVARRFSITMLQAQGDVLLNSRYSFQALWVAWSFAPALVKNNPLGF